MENLKVFADLHHASLLYSLILLFEGRLGGEVFRPIGKDWYDKGFWKIYDHPATVEQFLGIGGATPDGTPKLNEVIQKEAFLYHCKDIDSDKTNKAITFDGFMSTHFDIVIASIPQHIEPFKRLCELHPSKPKLIFQIGNAWSAEATGAKNIMASAVVDNVPSDINFISYHQEFDTNLFRPSSRTPQRGIYSFVNCFNVQDHFQADYALFQEVESIMRDFDFKVFGGQCRDGAMHGSKQLAMKMREAKFIWHTKNGGDGYGHVIHNACAVGKPLIVKKSYYQGKLAEPLLIDRHTCINIDGLSTAEIVSRISEVSESQEMYENMCQNMTKKFKEVVNFDREEQEIRQFIQNLK